VTRLPKLPSFRRFYRGLIVKVEAANDAYLGVASTPYGLVRLQETWATSLLTAELGFVNYVLIWPLLQDK
jgi:hypothetical protein